ncbi:Hypothetical Protein FCC1311_106742 [Hondaea fermentalgiana]|uniref:PH domain-containing protein n=1 Tax=Hondaea fermentalgiana TaxID=2315210 RepID=A0A2R5GUC9_9STRA|nr:Hypothetical Protein FCC1311_106742 [Hondaea fermentalgiana]|eukprot:GBG34450.1 Hypothetical Protein FCC1311_106742 [Hondaea fermentalgiana]
MSVDIGHDPSGRSTLAQRFERELQDHGRPLQRHGALLQRLRAADKDLEQRLQQKHQRSQGLAQHEAQGQPVSATSTRAAQGTGRTGDSETSEVGFRSPRRHVQLSISSMLRAVADDLDNDSDLAVALQENIDDEHEHYNDYYNNDVDNHDDDDVDSLVTSIRSLTARHRVEEVSSHASSSVGPRSHHEDDDNGEEIEEDDFVTAQEFSVASSRTSARHAQKAKQVKKALAERLAILEQEEALVRTHLQRLGSTRLKKGPQKQPLGAPSKDGAVNRADGDKNKGAPRLKRALRIQGPRDGPAADANELLAPILEEHFELANMLRNGTSMRAVLVRGSRPGDPHVCTEVFLCLNAKLDKLFWTLQEHKDDFSMASNDGDMSSVPIRGQGRVRAQQQRHSGQNAKHTFSLPLSDISAIFCAGLAEEEAMIAPPQTVFRLHVARKGVMPMQFAARSPASRQAWVAGLGLFSQLFTP